MDFCKSLILNSETLSPPSNTFPFWFEKNEVLLERAKEERPKARDYPYTH
jgi:hypothetical protein